MFICLTTLYLLSLTFSYVLVASIMVYRPSMRVKLEGNDTLHE